MLLQTTEDEIKYILVAVIVFKISSDLDVYYKLLTLLSTLSLCIYTALPSQYL